MDPVNMLTLVIGLCAGVVIPMLGLLFNLSQRIARVEAKMDMLLVPPQQRNFAHD